MANDRSKRDGKAASKEGKTGGQGWSSSLVDASIRRSENSSEDSEEAEDGDTGGARGRRGHPRKISHGIKRTAGFNNSNGAAGAGRTKSPDAKDTRVLNSRKKSKTDDADAKLLWSPGKNVEDSSGGADSQNLASLASSFKERYGEDLALCEDELGESGHSKTASSEQPASNRRSNGLGGMEAVEETARSMSPAKLAIEVQKARARAREERFGGGAKASPNAAMASSIDKPAIQLAVPLTEGHADVRRQLPDASGGEVGNGEGMKPSQAKVAAPVQSSNPIQEAAAAPSIAVSASAKESLNLTGKVGSRAESARTISAPPAELSAAASIPEKTIDARRSPIVHTIDAEEDEADESGAEAAVGAMETVVSTEDVIFSRETPSMTVASKKNGPHEGDIAAFEPLAKKMTTALAKVLTLRLRLRSDVANGAAYSDPDGGVEESKGFEPPNPPEDSGVEECKGFDPPNLPPTPAPESRFGPVFPEAIMVSSDSIVEPKDPPTPSVACSSSVSPAVEMAAPATTSGINSYTPGERAPTPVLIRQNSWGPSFGIFQETETATAVPVNPAAAPSNPWIISPDAPTFARNQGRPLARSFPLLPTREKAVPGDEKGMEPAVSSKRKRATRSGSMACRESDGNDGSVAVSAGGAYKGDDIGVRRAPHCNDTALSRPLKRTRPRATMSIDARDRTRDDPVVQASQPRMFAASAHAPGGKGDDSGGDDTGAASPDGPGQDLELPFDGGAGKLLEKLKREREESLDFERKLTKALLDL